MRLARRIGLCLLLLVFVAGCTKNVVVPDEVKHEYTYAQALKFFNDTMESYTYYLARASLITQTEVAIRIDPTVQAANIALDNWGKALNDQTRRQAYLDLERQMVHLFLTYGVLRGGGV